MAGNQPDVRFEDLVNFYKEKQADDQDVNNYQDNVLRCASNANIIDEKEIIDKLVSGFKNEYTKSLLRVLEKPTMKDCMKYAQIDEQGQTRKYEEHFYDRQQRPKENVDEYDRSIRDLARKSNIRDERKIAAKFISGLSNPDTEAIYVCSMTDPRPEDCLNVAKRVESKADNSSGFGWMNAVLAASAGAAIVAIASAVRERYR